MGGRPADQALWRNSPFIIGFFFAASWRTYPPSLESLGAKVRVDQPWWGRLATLLGPPGWCLVLCVPPSQWSVEAHGDNLFYIWLNFPFGPLKSSKLHSGFLKSNKHKNYGTRLVDRVLTWSFLAYAWHVSIWNWRFMTTNRESLFLPGHNWWWQASPLMFLWFFMANLWMIVESFRPFLKHMMIDLSSTSKMTFLLLHDVGQVPFDPCSLVGGSEVVDELTAKIWPWLDQASW
jgi:hypothetical protein